jgi:hypothetical protein
MLICRAINCETARKGNKEWCARIIAQGFRVNGAASIYRTHVIHSRTVALSAFSLAVAGMLGAAEGTGVGTTSGSTAGAAVGNFVGERENGAGRQIDIFWGSSIYPGRHSHVNAS